MKIVFYLICIVMLFSRCTSKEQILKNRIDFLINNIKEEDFFNLFRFSAIYSFRCCDDEGNKFIKDLLYTDTLNNTYTLHNFQKVKSKMYSYDESSFYKYLDITNNEGEIYIKLISKQMIQLITKYDLYSIISPNEESISFHISESTKVIFLKDSNNNINSNLQDVLKDAYLLKPNWYLLNDSAESQRLFELYKSN